MGIARDLFLAGSPMRDMLASAAPLPTPQPQPEIPEPPPTDNPFMSLVHGAGKVLGMARRPVDVLAAAAAGMPDPLHTQETVGSLAKAALLPDEPTPSDLPLSSFALMSPIVAPLVAGVQGLRKFNPKAAEKVAGPARAITETAYNLGTDPLTVAAPSSRLASAGFAGLGAVQGVESGVEAAKTLSKEGLSGKALEEATSAGLGLGMAGLGAAHALKGAEPTPAEARVAERRVAEEPVPTERRVLDRRARLAEEFPTADPALLDRVHAAETDPLTGLPNKIALARDAAQHKGAVATFDIGGMKYVNDNLGGHPAGDAMIKAFGDAILEEPNVQGYRAGPSGDEFYILAETPEGADTAGQNIRARFQKATFRSTRPDGQVVEYTGGEASHGVAPISPEQPFSEALSAADRDLYERRQLAEDLGLRVPRGSKPRSLAEVPAGGEQVRGDLAAEGGEPQPPAAPALPAAEPIKPTRAFDQAQPEVVPTSVGDEVAALRAGLEKAKGARVEQETLRHEEMSRRAGAVASALEAGRGTGASAFHKALAELKGEIPKADFEPVVQGLSERQITNLHEGIQQAKLTPLEKVSTFKALQKVLHPETPQIPQPHELALLERTFGPDLVKSIETKRATGEVWKQRVLNLINTPRTAMSILDMSIPLRQGLVLSVSHPLKAAQAFAGMVKSTFSPAFFEKVKDDVRLRPTADFQNQSGLYLGVKQGLTRLEGREEAFQSNLLHKIPGVKHIVAASERAGMSYLDKIRADVFDLNFDSLAKVKERDLGHALNAGEKLQLGQSLAQYINSATGRGNLGGLERAAGALNAVFFSPRLAKGRLDLLNPFYYKSLDPVVRRQAIADMTRLGVVGVGLVTLAKLGGADVETDPRSSDFGKMRFGKTRIDPWGGFQPWVRFAAQLYGSADPLHGKLGTGLRKKLTGAVVNESRADLAGRFAVQKLSPQAALVLDLLRGKTALGDEVSLSQEVKERLVPLFIQDLKQVAEDNPDLALGAGIAGFFGAGVQTYDEPGTPTAMERYLKDEMERLGYEPEEPSSHTTIKGRKIDLEPDEVRTLKKAQMKAADEARRVIRSSHYRRLSDTDRKYELERIFQKWRSRGHQRIQSGVKARYRDLPREPAGPQVGLGG